MNILNKEQKTFIELDELPDNYSEVVIEICFLRLPLKKHVFFLLQDIGCPG